MPVRLLARLAALTLPLLSACDVTSHECTERGCIDGFVVDLEPTSGWPAGEYAFSLTADGASQTCTARIPLPSCDSPAVTCTGAALAMLGASGCALPPNAQGFASIQFTGSPKDVHLSVTRDGAPLVERDFTPVYTTSQPNGPECPPVCHNASDSVTVGGLD